MSEKKKELLEIIAFKANCIYISDLRLSQNTLAIRAAVASIKAEDFSLEEWQNVVRYILGNNIKIKTQQQGKDKFGTG